MIAGFGSISARSVASDRLERGRDVLDLRPFGLRQGAGRQERFEVADLELLGSEAEGPSWPDVMEGWPDPATRALLAWAVVHAAVRSPATIHLHADTVCTLADAPPGATPAGDLALNGVVRVEYAAPGPDLARVLAGAAAAGATAALVPHVGLVVWGASDDEVVARAAALSDRAAALLPHSSHPPFSETVVAAADAATDAARERVLVSIRGRMSHRSHVVMAVDESLLAIAMRPDAGRVMATATAAEATSPWAGVLKLANDPPDVLDGSGTDVLLVPGIGLLSGGWDEADARARGVAAAHTLRVAAALIDGFGGGASGGLVAPAMPSATDESLRPDLPATGRIYIVTGAASGIGRDIARHLGALGAQLALADVDPEGLEVLADDLAGTNGRPVTVAGDLTDEAVVDRLVGATVRRFGGVDGAVLNVGIALPGAIRELSASDWRRSLEVNATSHFLLAKRMLPVLEAQGLGGSLVFIGSKNMFSPGAQFGAYSASKAALAQLARVVAIEAGPFGVRSNIVNPDNVFEGSALWSPEVRAQRATVYQIRPDELEAYYTQRNLMKVPISGTDVARAVAFLLSDQAAKTTACVLTVDGGVPGVFPR